MSTVVRSEVASRSAGIDCRRGFDPIDRSIFVDSRAVFSSLIQNQEVALSMARLYADELLRKADRLELGVPKTALILANGSLDDIVGFFNKTFNVIDYQRFPVADEFACRAFLQVLLLGAAMMPKVEVHSAHGRSDLEVDAGDRHWVFEIKFARSEAEVESLLQEGIRQVRHRHYGEALHSGKLCRAVLVFEKRCRAFSAWTSV